MFVTRGAVGGARTKDWMASDLSGLDILVVQIVGVLHLSPRHCDRFWAITFGRTA